MKWEQDSSYWVEVRNGVAHVRYYVFLTWETEVTDGEYRIRNIVYHQDQVTYVTLQRELGEAIEKHNTTLAATAGV